MSRSALALAAPPISGVTTGNVPLKSAGALAFGKDGVLFVSDTIAGSLFAIETMDAAKSAKFPTINIKAVNEKAAALLCTTAD